MNRNLWLVIIALLTFNCNSNESKGIKEEEQSSVKVKLELISSGLNPTVAMAHAGDGRIFIVEQPGTIRIIENNKLLQDPFLDITSKVESDNGYSEKGLLGLAFHPDYKNNGRFFVYYSTEYNVKNFDHKCHLSEFKVSTDNRNKAELTERIILEIPQPESNHNGGQIAFGPDGYLYIGSGDGGGGNDQHGKIGNGQNLNTLLGKMLRIDVDGSPYKIPEDNPFVGREGVRPEIWAYGLRNPWRFSFDRTHNNLYCGDVGQDRFEEIDLIKKGGNFGWRAMEANRVADKDLVKNDMIPPIYEYPRDIGVCVIGGYVYSGKKIPALHSKYIFADWQGKLFSLEKSGNTWNAKQILKGDYLINSLGEDASGELYVLTQKENKVDTKTGAVYKLVRE